MFFQCQNWRKLPNLTEISFHQMKQNQRWHNCSEKLEKSVMLLIKQIQRIKISACHIKHSPSFWSLLTTTLTDLQATKCVSQMRQFNKCPLPPFLFWGGVVLTPWVRELSLQNPHEERDQPGNTTHFKCPPKMAQQGIREIQIQLHSKETF